ncbi:MFS general substrate transporter [Fomitiporia mediterranea MF3/22]|uniref:MFS general substrate transporter n=1 Tax=Fomitiporia mediterranea (strain MF3/22) TaxID=694068 RepID=UPI000440844F|nr:MFS general substrate transporter [Fomitiporia mediterranea MF3/22]EJD04780.1 MFS general substrate transporter [Fomitiporia mediterranea MF3/22]
MQKEEVSDPEDGSVSIQYIEGEINVNTTSGNANSIQTPRQNDASWSGGRFWAWATVVSAFIIQFAGFGYANAFGVFQDFYVREFLTSSSSSQISWIGSTQTFFMLTMGIFTGRLFDKGYCYHLVYTGTILLVFSLFMLSLARPEQYYQVFLAQGLGVGMGAGLSYTPSLAVLAQHFPSPHARARVMGIATAGSSLGGLTHPILLNQLFHHNNDGGIGETRKVFARGTRASAGLVAGLLLIALLFLRTKYPNKDGIEMTDEDREKEGHERKPMKLKPMVVKFASDCPYVYFVIGMTLYEMVFFFPAFYLQLDAIKRGLDPTFAFYSLSILNGVSFFGRLVPGFFARPLGVANMFVFSTAGATVLIFCMLAVRTIPGVATFAALYGFFSGAFITLMSPMLVLLAEGPAEIGARMGMCFAFTGVGSLIGTPIAGALLTSRFLWWRPIIFSGIICVFGFALFMACRIILGRRKGSAWLV